MKVETFPQKAEANEVLLRQVDNIITKEGDGKHASEAAVPYSKLYSLASP